MTVGHLVDDPNSNTYRALRFTVGASYFADDWSELLLRCAEMRCVPQEGSPYGDLLYSEFTALADYNFSNVSFYELYNVRGGGKLLL